MTSTVQAPAVPATMRAWVRRRRGPAKTTLVLATDVPVPALPAGNSADILVRVSYVALQFNSDLLLRVAPKLPLVTHDPFIPELEFSGVVVAAGSGAPAEVREPGTHVVAFKSVSDYFVGEGVLAEYVRLPGNQASRIDSSVPLAGPSGVHGCGCTAVKMVRTAGLREGQTVLVNGASGSVGAVFVQLCKLRGVKVIGVASGANEEMVRGLGADEFIDYRKHQPLPDYLAQKFGDQPLDYVFDCVGLQPLYTGSPGYLKADGAVVNIGAIEGSLLGTLKNFILNTWLPSWLGGVSRRYIMFSTPPTRDDGAYVAHLIEEGKVTIPVDSVFPMEDALAGYDRVETKRARGKVVIKVHGD